VLVGFAITPTTSVLVTLVDDQGQEVPMGARATMTGDESQALMVGFGGQLYIDQALTGALVRVEATSGACTFRLPQAIAPESAGIVGRMTCEAGE
jgi:outer membrane usher protein